MIIFRIIRRCENRMCFLINRDIERDGWTNFSDRSQLTQVLSLLALKKNVAYKPEIQFKNNEKWILFEKN